MAKIIRGGQSGSLDHLNSSQATFRTQISALTDAVRQLGGNPEVAAGATINDPLNAPYVLYVNPYTGKDTFVGGSYSTSGSATERIELQRLECGYSESRPFKTINRAIIEAGIVTAKSYYESPLVNNDLVSIILLPGAATVLNGTGASSVTEWASVKSPTDAELQAFNPNATGGVLLPRGVSLCGIDLRKTIFRPDSVPSVADEASDAANRRAIFKVTGTGYYFGFTFMDKVGSTSSHHLLSAFEFASQAELDEFYTKIRAAFGGANNTGNLDNTLAVTRNSEYELVGPQPAAGSQTIATDTTLSASPYIFNCSIRSNYGLCGVYADGAKTSGFRSIVLAQFTGVSLQRDLSCWQKYDSAQGSPWGAYFANYAEYISTAPDNVRMHPSRRSFHIRAVNNAIIQEVSVFAIGQGVHHWTQNGGELTITNSNSNFGGCAAISEGYRSAAFAADTNWNVNRIRVANNLASQANNVKKIYLGTVSAVTSSTITLASALGESTTVTGVPALLARDGYSLRNGSYIWVENPLGTDWRTALSSSAWSSGTPSIINTTAALVDENGTTPGTTTAGASNAVGKRLYIRRIVDTRLPSERRFTLKLNNTTQTARIPLRDYVLQVRTGTASINSAIPISSTVLVGTAGKITADGVNLASEIVLRRGNASTDWTSDSYYAKGETVKRSGKHYTCNTSNTDTVFNANKWDESYVHMESSYNPEDFYKTEAPQLIFDNDTSGSDTSSTLGYNFSTVWSSDALVQAQYRSAADYRGLHLFLTALGFSTSQAHTILTPKTEASRDLDPANSTDMGGFAPTGAANSRANWPVEFRRPSVIRLFGHAWEWSGFLNYTKAIPEYQGELSPQNKFSYYFTNVNGGRVYATGFNEEGFQVNPRGVEDISTGDSLTVDNLGSGDITLDQPTELVNIKLSGATVIEGALNLEGVNSLTSGPLPNLTLVGTTAIDDILNMSNVSAVTLSSAFNATTAIQGVGTLATKADLLNATSPATDADINTQGNKFVNGAGLIYLADQRYAAKLTAAARRLFVLPAGSSLPANAAAYPLIEGGTINLNTVTTYTTIQTAYASLPEQFTLPEGTRVEIYLLNNTIDCGTVSQYSARVGSIDPLKLTYVIPNQWDQDNQQQIIRYTIAFPSYGDGLFRNVVFYTLNPLSAPIVTAGRVKLEVTADPVPSEDPLTTMVVGTNITSTNLWVQLTLSSNDSVARHFIGFNGFKCYPFVTYSRHNERPIYFKFSLEGAGQQVTIGARWVHHLTIFETGKDCPVSYGAAMATNSSLTGLSDENKRKSTALFEFVNNRSTPAKVVFHHIREYGIMDINGAGYGGWTTNITWRLSGTSAWQWRLFTFEGLAGYITGEAAALAKAYFTSTSVTCQTWGGLINSNSSTNLVTSVYSPGPFNTIYCEPANWGLFGAGGNVTAANSLMGANAGGYYLRPDATRYNIVNPAA